MLFPSTINSQPSTSLPCPWLPEIGGIHDFTITRRHGGARGTEFYWDALCYAQSQWLAGKPAQAILQINKAWLADPEEVASNFSEHASPYRALIWIMEQSKAGDRGFLGNPVRHFQHLASRVSGQHARVRSWRAWVCFHLAEGVLDRANFPRDGQQLTREGLWIPRFDHALAEVSARGWPGEGAAIREAMQGARSF